MSHIINFHTFGYSPQDIPCPDVYLDKLFVILTIPADLCQIQFRYKQLEIPIEAIAITLQPKGEELVGEQMNWAWNDDCFRGRTLWRKAFLENHGSGLVSQKVELELEMEKMSKALQQPASI